MFFSYTKLNEDSDISLKLDELTNSMRSAQKNNKQNTKWHWMTNTDMIQQHDNKITVIELKCSRMIRIKFHHHLCYPLIVVELSICVTIFFYIIPMFCNFTLNLIKKYISDGMNIWWNGMISYFSKFLLS